MSRSRRLSLSFAAAAFAALVPSFASAQTVSKPAPGVTLVSDGTHAMTVADLCAPGVRIRATEYGERKATPEEWATKPTVNAVAAVNGDFFDFPGWTIVHGMARGGGQPWPAAAQLVEGRHHFLFGPHYSDLQKDTVAAPATTVASDIIGCHNVIVSAGKSLAPNFDGDSVILGSYRRTAIGISKERDAVYLFASDQALSGAQLASYVLTYAAKAGHPDVDVACNMDGGGSSQMYVKGHGQIVTSGREVNNHLGIIATGSGDAPMCPNHPSHGYLDSADCTKGLAGWAQDPDAPSSSIHVDAYYDGVPGAAGATGVRLEADVDRSDLLKAIGSTNHGYTMDLPLSLYDSKQHTVYAYAIDSKGGEGAENPLLTGAPKKFTCAPTTVSGVRRHITSQTALAAWHLTFFLDVMPVSDAVIAALPEEEALPDAPELVRADDKSPEIWLVDGTTKHHVPSAAIAARWQLDLTKTKTIPKAQVDALRTVGDLRARPVAIKGTGAAVYLVDDPIDPSTPDGGVTVYPDGGVELPDGGVGSAGDLPNGETPEGEGGDDGGGCSSAPHAPTGAWSAFGLALAFAAYAGARRRRR